MFTVLGAGACQHDDVGPGRAGLLAYTLEPGQRFPLIIGHVEVYGDRALLECGAEALYVRKIVGHQ